jgi:hypothetical protein
LSHHLPRFELYNGSWRDLEAAPWLIGVPSDSFFRQTNFENPEIPKFNRLATGKTVGNQVKRSLDDVKDFMLNQTGIVTDLYNNVPFRQVSHRESFHRFEIVWHFRWPTAVSSAAANDRR